MTVTSEQNSIEKVGVNSSIRMRFLYETMIKIMQAREGTPSMIHVFESSVLLVPSSIKDITKARQAVANMSVNK